MPVAIASGDHLMPYPGGGVARSGLVFTVQVVGAPRDEFVLELLAPRSAGNANHREHAGFLRDDRLVTFAGDRLRLWRY